MSKRKPPRSPTKRLGYPCGPNYILTPTSHLTNLTNPTSLPNGSTTMHSLTRSRRQRGTTNPGGAPSTLQPSTSLRRAISNEIVDFIVPEVYRRIKHNFDLPWAGLTKHEQERYTDATRAALAMYEEHQRLKRKKD